ncbi:hypothetical protein PINS_up013569 [Pythium insidiosum]|nr:hypothetical protein PINS_up013569 [Pythium insidiosum]
MPTRVTGYHAHAHTHERQRLAQPRSLEDEAAPLWRQRRHRWDNTEDWNDVALTTTVFHGGGRAARGGSEVPQPRRALLAAPSIAAPREGQQVSRHRTGRASRYLRECDRRAILERIKNGEKQADLAKEYQVSRAAISNLKQRRQLKERLEAMGESTPSDTDDSGVNASRVSTAALQYALTRGEFHEVSTASMPLLVARLHQQILLPAEEGARTALFHLVQRITRLLLEEALSRYTPSKLQTALLQPQAKFMEDELVFLEPTCARMDSPGGKELTEHHHQQQPQDARVVLLLGTEMNARDTATQLARARSRGVYDAVVVTIAAEIATLERLCLEWPGVQIFVAIVTGRSPSNGERPQRHDDFIRWLHDGLSSRKRRHSASSCGDE